MDIRGDRQAMKDVQHITVPKDDDGQRLDRWLKKNIDEISFVMAQKLIRTGQIRIDGKRAKPDTRLVAGQEIRLPPMDERPEKQDGYRLREEDAEMIIKAVLYDDGDILAINKPAGIATQGGNKIERHIDGMLEALTGKDGVKPRLVHRLDKDTSGVLLLARSAEMARRLCRMFQGRDMRKIYWAITSPAPKDLEGEIKAPLIKGTHGPEKDKMLVDEKEGQRAYTNYEVMEVAGRQAAFVAFMPKTGRTHQIRVHAAHMGFPLLGDAKYGVKAAIEAPGITQRLHLHARSLEFRHPGTGKKLKLHAPLPPDLVKSWDALGFTKKPDHEPFSGV
jgi:23S rRNA pseudouridine955/2504/2580 synthase